MDEARDFLQDFLADGPQPAKAVASAAKKAGISDITLRRAKAGIVRLLKVSVAGGERGAGSWLWSLQGDHDGQSVLQTPDEHLDRPEEAQQIQYVTRNDQDAHVITLIDNRNPPQDQTVTSHDQDDHVASAPRDGQQDHLDRLDRSRGDDWPFPGTRGI
jgi:hypothetical protein